MNQGLILVNFRQIIIMVYKNTIWQPAATEKESVSFISFIYFYLLLLFYAYKLITIKLLYLRGLDAIGKFSARFYKGSNFCNFLLAFLHSKPFSVKGSIQQQRICSPKHKFCLLERNASASHFCNEFPQHIFCRGASNEYTQDINFDGEM